MADVFTPELTFGPYQSGMETPTAPGVPYRTIQQNSFTPASLTSLSKWYQASDSTTVFQSGTRGAPGTAAGDGNPIGLVLNKANALDDLVQTTSAAKPTRRLSGGLWFFEGDGVDDALSNAFGAALAQPNTIIVGYRYISIVPNAYIFDGIAGQRHANFSIAPSLNEITSFAGAQLGTGVAADLTAHVITMVFNGASSKIRIDGIDKATGDMGAQLFGGLNMFLFNAGGVFANARIADFICCNAVSSATEITNAERYVAAEVGATVS